MIIIMVASLGLFILLGTNLLSYQSSINIAKSQYNEAMGGIMSGDSSYISKYTTAYKELAGVELKKADQPLFDKLIVLSAVSSQYDAYVTFKKAGYEAQALDNLICAAGRCKENEDTAKEIGCDEQLNAIYLQLGNILQEQYGMTIDEALAIYSHREREEYTIAVHKKLIELGLE